MKHNLIYYRHDIAKMKYFLYCFALKAFLYSFKVVLESRLKIIYFPVVGLQGRLTSAIEGMDYI